MSAYYLTPYNVDTRLQRFAIRTLNLFGWKARYQPLPGPRGVVVVYPHTSNWDFFVGLLFKWAIGLPFSFIAKSSLFEGLTGASIGRFLRAIGGIPVERSTHTGAITRLAERINQSSWCWLVITPEGTRSYRPYWRSGFYHIARAANVPVACAYFDFAQKEVGLVDVLDLSGDPELDMARIRAILANYRGCRPTQAAPIALRPESDKKEGVCE